jgi:ubiquinone/menaquinone biosynthesis C-methylase UbiE
METPVYDTIGKSYNTTRRADPYLAGRMYALLQPKPGGLYLDVGCGTANYLTALAHMGLQFTGIDPSTTMLAEAAKKDHGATLINTDSTNIPLPDNHFDGVLASFTLHHWKDKLAGLTEVCRVMKPGARLVFLSFTPEQLMNYWLHHYFPEMIRLSAELLLGIEGMEALLNQSGLQLVATEKYFVQDDLQDHFLYSNKRRPEQYLRPEIRNNASSFSAFSTPGEVEAGLIQLKADIDSGKINDIMKQYDNDLGDYLFLVAEKPKA